MIEYLTFEELLEIQASMIRSFGGLRGIRDENLLHSVIELPKSTMFGEDLYPTIFDKAAAYLFLKANGIAIRFKDDDLENLVVEVAKGDAGKVLF